jgi:iron complex outermembrane receptor protein
MNLPAFPRRALFAALRVLIVSALVSLAAHAAEEAKRSYNVPAADAAVALRQFSETSGKEVLFAAETVRGVRTPALRGDFTPPQALAALLAGTGLVATPDARSGAFAVRKEIAAEAKNDPRAAPTAVAPRDRNRTDGEILNLDRFEVMGQKLLNMDLRRTRDDVQPYVVFDQTAIANSGAVDIEDFLKQRLTMNAHAVTSDTTGQNSAGSTSSIDLRGLGVGQTLILVDGRRLAGATFIGNPRQPDLNGIPMSAIERIEVLPSTASGIYGGGATGGVVNIVLRRDYGGGELSYTYDNTFDTDSSSQRVDLGVSHTSRSGKTSVLLTATYFDRQNLQSRDRDFRPRGVNHILRNNSALLLGNVFFPPTGSTSNIRSATGANLTLKSTGASLSSPNTFAPAGYAATDGGAALVANAGGFNWNLADSTVGDGGHRALRAPSERYSVNLTLRQSILKNLEAYVEAALARNETEFSSTSVTSSFTLAAANPTNPFNQQIRVTTPGNTSGNGVFRSTNDTNRLVFGLLGKLGRDWQWSADYAWSHNKLDVVGGPTSTAQLVTDVAAGAVNVLRSPLPIDYARYLGPPSFYFTKPYEGVNENASLRAAGSVFELPAGAVSLASLLEWRRDVIEQGAQFNAGSITVYPERSQSVRSASAELKVPVIGAARRIRFVDSLNLQAAVRRDEYTVNGVTGSLLSTSTAPLRRAVAKVTSNDPSLGFGWKLNDDATVRVSWGTGFLPPSVNQILSTPSTALASVIDSRRGGQSAVLAIGELVSGGNPDLDPEKSESLSAGVVLTPRFAPGLRVSVDYTNIKKTDNIITPAAQFIADNEALFPGRVRRGPVPPGDPFGVGPIIRLDNSAVNISGAEIEAFDVAVNFTRRTGSFGTFEPFVYATWQTHFITQVLPTSPRLENVGLRAVGSTSIPVKFKANAGLNWNLGRYRAGWAAQYYDSYFTADPKLSTSSASLLAQGNGGKVETQIYHDVFAGYRFASGVAGTKFSWRSLLADTEVRIGVRNVLNTLPPVDVTRAGYYYSAFGDPRGASYYITLKRSF